MQKKAFDKIKHLFIMESLKKVGIEKMYNNIIKATSDKPTAKNKLNSGNLKAFP